MDKIPPGTILRAALGLLAVPAMLALSVPPADAQPTVEARDATMSTSASCSQGDIEIDYAGTGLERQLTQFTAQDGRTLHAYDTRAFAASYDGTEYILSQTRQPPPAGSIVAVHVTIGTSPPDRASGEFFVAYRCDNTSNEDGGTNVVVGVCTGPYGTCPTTAVEFLNPKGLQVPRFTG